MIRTVFTMLVGVFVVSLLAYDYGRTHMAPPLMYECLESLTEAQRVCGCNGFSSRPSGNVKMKRCAQMTFFYRR